MTSGNSPQPLVDSVVNGVNLMESDVFQVRSISGILMLAKPRTCIGLFEWVGVHEVKELSGS